MEIVARDRISVSHFIDVAYLGRLSLHSVSKSESSDDHQWVDQGASGDDQVMLSEHLGG